MNNKYYGTRYAVCASLAFATLIGFSAHSQTFYLDAVASGSTSLSAQTPISSGGISVSFSALHETVILDPVGQTARQIGTINSTPSASGFVFNETQLVPSSFPNPPVSLSATITVNLALADGNINFDTGAQPVVWSPSAQAYAINGQIGNIPVIGSYIMSTGGKNYSGSFNYYLFNVYGSAFTYRTLSTQGYPNSISLKTTGTEGGFFGYQPSVNIVADVVADNGFHLLLSPSGVGFSWSATDATAVVPEPEYYAAFTGLSLVAFATYKRFKRNAKL